LGPQLKLPTSVGYPAGARGPPGRGLFARSNGPTLNRFRISVDIGRMETAAVQRCPDCSADLPETPGYPTWCEKCEWNLRVPERPAPRSQLERAYARAGERLGDRLLAELERAPSLEPRLRPATLAAMAIAAVVHLATVGLAALGLWLIVSGHANPFAIILGVVAVGAARLMRPRLGKPPNRDLMSRAQAPTLFALIDQVAESLGTRGPDLLIVDESHNAFWTTSGVRRRRVLCLGLALFDPLDPQERVALIAHELAHGRNGDSSRGLLIAFRHTCCGGTPSERSTSPTRSRLERRARPESSACTRSCSPAPPWPPSPFARCTTTSPRRRCSPKRGRRSPRCRSTSASAAGASRATSAPNSPRPTPRPDSGSRCSSVVRASTPPSR
jgi:Peptidase family M48